MRRTRTAARAFAALLVLALVLAPAVAAASEDHSHGEGDFLWPCGIFLAPWIATILFAMNAVVESRGGPGIFGRIGQKLETALDVLFPGGTNAPGPSQSGAPSPAAAGQAAQVEPAQPPVTEAPTEPEAMEPQREEAEPAPPQTEPEKPEPPRKPEREKPVPGEAKSRWNPVTKTLEVRVGDLWVEAGAKGAYYGRGGGPDHDPFRESVPEVVDARVGRVKLHRREDTYSAEGPAGRSGAQVRATFDAQTGASSVSRRDFRAEVSGDTYKLQERIGGQKTGGSYNAATDDFALYRGTLRAGRTGDVFSLSNEPKGGRPYELKFGDHGRQLEASVGGRGVLRDGSQYGYVWRQHGVAYDARADAGAVMFPIQHGRGSVTVGGGSQGQYGYDGTHAIRLFGKPARLNAAFERYLEQTTTGREQMRRERSLGLDVGRVKVRVDQDDRGTRPSIRYNLNF